MQKLRSLDAGFTLIEVMVAVVVLALGLLGLAGLQAASLRNNQNAYYRSMATQYAYNLADRVRVNTVEAKKGTASKYLTALAGVTEKASCKSTAGCTPAEMAENDLFLWKDVMSKELPHGTGSLTFNGGAFTATVRWDEDKDGDVDTDDPDFQISF